MSDIHFLIPNAKITILTVVGWGSANLASGGYSNTITLGSIVTAALVVVLGGLFTLRNNLKTFWKDRAEELEEKIKILEQHADEKLQERAAFAEEQRELRHRLTTESETMKGLLAVERAKHDLTPVFTRIDALESTLAASVAHQALVLEQILAALHDSSAAS